MKAIIFNSGLGKRMGALTQSRHKSMVRLSNGETVLERQIRLLSRCGIRDFIITIGAFEDQIVACTRKKAFSALNFTFVHNPIYDQTNYIYSMYLALPHLTGDALLLHGDLVFNQKLASDMLDRPEPSVAAVNQSKKPPEKDFKARLCGNLIREISVDIFGRDCYAFQPFYKLSAETLAKWCGQVKKYVEAGQVGVYAENALNEILPLDIRAFEYQDYYVDEIDTPEDLERVSSEIRQFDFDEQVVYGGPEGYAHLWEIFRQHDVRRPMIVCKNEFNQSFIMQHLKNLDVEPIIFDGYSANPRYEEIVKGVDLFHQAHCDLIISVGGGSAIDTAKSIKLFSALDRNQNFLEQECKYSDIPHLAIPTTAGTGSEATTFSVLYYQGEKQSIAHDSILPEYVILDPERLKTLSPYQKKAPLLDAMCQAVESFWSVHSNEKSKRYAEACLHLILENMNGFLENDDESLDNLLKAAHYSGKAINITKTTAAHAMSYPLTSLYGIAHGHAVALCLPHVWAHMLSHMDQCVDPRGRAYLETMFDALNRIWGAESGQQSIQKFNRILRDFDLPKPAVDRAGIEELTSSVNMDRLKNTPVKLDDMAIRGIYLQIFAG